MWRNLFSPELADGGQRSRRANAFRPVRTADKRGLRGLHHGFASEHYRHGIAVGDCLRKNRNIGINVQQPMNAAIRHAKPSRDFVKNQNRADFVGQAAHLLQKSFRWLGTSLRLHDDSRDLPRIFPNNRLQLVQPVVVEGKCCAFQTPRHAARLQAWQEVRIQRLVLRKIGCKVPIGPAVITAEGNLVPPCGSAGDAYSHSHRFAATTRVTHHLRPGVQLNQQVG